MARAGLLQAIGAVALLAAAPAFAQSNTQPADTGPGNSVVNPTANEPGGMAPSGMSGHNTRHSTMGNGMHATRTDTSQNEAVDQLNDQSLRAARQGQAFNGTAGYGSSGYGSPGQSNGSGTMNDMSGGSMSNGAAPR